MATEGIDVGDTLRIRGNFTVGLTTVLGDPTTVSLYVQPPSSSAATEYTYAGGTVTKSTEAASGMYYRDHSITEAGLWRVRYKGTGNVATAGEYQFEVREQTVST